MKVTIRWNYNNLQFFINVPLPNALLSEKDYVKIILINFYDVTLDLFWSDFYFCYPDFFGALTA